MRVVADPRHSDYWARRFATCPLILLNGAVVDHVHEADEERGYVIVTDVDEAGNCRATPDGQRIATKRLEGNVELIGADTIQ